MQTLELRSGYRRVEKWWIIGLAQKGYGERLDTLTHDPGGIPQSGTA